MKTQQILPNNKTPVTTITTVSGIKNQSPFQMIRANAAQKQS